MISLQGCVEHILFFEVLPDGSFEAYYSSHGNTQDMLDKDYIMPNGIGWKINQPKDLTDLESFDYSAYKKFKLNEKFPDNFDKTQNSFKNILFNNPASVNIQNWFVKKYITFESIIFKRDINIKYPSLMKLIEDNQEFNNALSNQILKELLEYTLSQINIEFNNKPILKKQIEIWIENQFSSSDYEMVVDFLEFENRLKLLFNQIINNIPYNEQKLNEESINLIKKDLTISIKLIDDFFDYKLVMPGLINYSNADTLIGDTLIWRISWDKYANHDFDIVAQSTINYDNRYIYILLLGIVLLLLSIFSFKKSKS